MSVRDERDVSSSESGGAGFNQRLTEAEARLARREGKGRAARAGSGPEMSGLGLALRLGTELVAGLAVGVVIGLALDRWLGFRALFLIIFALLGAVAGILNVVRVVGMTGAGIEAPPGDPSGDT